MKNIFLVAIQERLCLMITRTIAAYALTWVQHGMDLEICEPLITVCMPQTMHENMYDRNNVKTSHRATHGYIAHNI